MRRLQGILVLACAFLGVAAACSTFDEGIDAGGSDGGSDGGSEAGDDATSTADGSPAGDARSDAWVPCSQRGMRDSKHFCDDFDRGGAVDFSWDDLIVQPDAAVADLFEAGVGLGSSFRAHLPASSTPPGRAQLMLKKPAPPSKYRLELDVRVDAIPHAPDATSGFSHLVVVQFDDAPCFTGTNKQRALELSLYALGERVTLLEKGLTECPLGDASAPPTNDDFDKTPTQLLDGAFHHVSIAIEKGPCPGTTSKAAVYSRFDAYQPQCRGLGIDVFADSANFTTYVGPYVGNGPYDDLTYVYDNVTIDLE